MVKKARWKFRCRDVIHPTNFHTAAFPHLLHFSFRFSSGTRFPVSLLLTHFSLTCPDSRLKISPRRTSSHHQVFMPRHSSSQFLLRSLLAITLCVLSRGSSAHAKNPVPTLTSISPAGASAGSSGFTMQVYGTKFVNGALVQLTAGAARQFSSAQPSFRRSS